MDITIILKVILYALFLLAAKYFVPWMKAQKTNSDMMVIMSVAKQVVSAANELGLVNEIEDKATYAWEQAVAILNEKKVSFNEDELKMYIKSAVTQLRTEIEGTDAQKTKEQG